MLNDNNGIPNNNSKEQNVGQPYHNDNYMYEGEDQILNTSSGFRAPKSKEKKFLTVKASVILVVICIVSSIVLGFGGGFAAYKYMSSGSMGNLALQFASPRETNSQSVAYTGEEMSTSQIADYASDSVVEISTETVQRGSMMQQYVVQGAGSGVIVAENGYIITNNHVIEGASKITVRLKSLETYNATIVGTDSDMDIALLKVEKSGLKPVVIGDSLQLTVGQKSVAIGNPLGELGGTVTEGIISSLDRTIMINNRSMSLLQTDAAINPGNSGGGLFNSKGEFVGLVVAKSSGEDVEGLGFAIPSNNIKSIIDDLSKYGYVKGKPQLGVSLVDINSTQVALKNGVSQLGVYVAQVSENSGARAAGIQNGDCILLIDDTPISTSAEVQQKIKSHAVGDVIKIEILRAGQRQTMSVTLGESVPSSQ